MNECEARDSYYIFFEFYRYWSLLEKNFLSVSKVGMTVASFNRGHQFESYQFLFNRNDNLSLQQMP